MRETNSKHVLKIKDILEITKGKLITGNENEECFKFLRDTREINGGEIYIGLVGEKTNGAYYFEQALEKGAIGVILQNIIIYIL